MSESAPPNLRGRAVRSAGPLALLAGLILLVYWPALRGGFIWDDDSFLTGNRLIRAADGLRRFWFTREAADYWPMTSTTLWVEWRWWGRHAAGYHATNVALHFAATKILAADRRTAEAIAEYRTALEFNPDSVPAHDSLGNLLFHEGRIGEAIGQWKTALRLRPDDAEAREDLARAQAAIP